MKRLWGTIVVLSVIIVGCSNSSDKEAIKELLKDQTNSYSVLVFRNTDLEDNFMKKISETINEINNQILLSDGITNVSFIDVRDKGKYDFEKILKLDDYSQIILFQKETAILKTNNPDDLYLYFKNKNS